MDLCPTLAAVAVGERALLAQAPLSNDLRDLAWLALSGPGSVLVGATEPRWARLPLLACASAAGSPEAAIPLAVLVEVQTAAFSLLDDLEDGDPTVLASQVNGATALNVATALLLLAQQAHARVAAPVAAVMTASWLAACAGQHRDLTLNRHGPDPLGAAIQAAEGKTAGISAAALEAGALLGGADTALAVCYRRFGQAVGMAGQFANDLAGCRPGQPGMTDLRRGRPTLPVLFALGSDSTPAVRACLTAAQDGDIVTDTLHAQALEEVQACGALHYVWALLRQARADATSLLADIARRRPVAGTLDRLL